MRCQNSILYQDMLKSRNMYLKYDQCEIYYDRNSQIIINLAKRRIQYQKAIYLWILETNKNIFHAQITLLDKIKS